MPFPITVLCVYITVDAAAGLLRFWAVCGLSDFGERATESRYLAIAAVVILMI